MKYKGGYKYQIVEDYFHRTDICVKEGILTDFIILDRCGILYIKKGYAWDGPSGPAIDTRNFMRGSLVHDALYQLIREGYNVDRKAADNILYDICLEDGMSYIRAWWVYVGVRYGGGLANTDKEVFEAP